MYAEATETCYHHLCINMKIKYHFYRNFAFWTDLKLILHQALSHSNDIENLMLY